MRRVFKKASSLLEFENKLSGMSLVASPENYKRGKPANQLTQFFSYECKGGLESGLCVELNENDLMSEVSFHLSALLCESS